MLYDLIEFSEPFASLISEGYQTDIILKAIKANNFLHLTGVPLPLHTVR